MKIVLGVVSFIVMVVILIVSVFITLGLFGMACRIVTDVANRAGNRYIKITPSGEFLIGVTLLTVWAMIFILIGRGAVCIMPFMR